MSVTKPIGTVQCDAVLLALLGLFAVSVVLCVLVVILSTVPGGKLGMLTAAKLQVAAREKPRVSLSLLSCWLGHYASQQYHIILVDAKHWEFTKKQTNKQTKRPVPGLD